MKVRILYELTTQYEAIVDYDELAEAWNADAAEHSEDPRPALPSQERLLEVRDHEFGTVRIEQYADGSVDQLLVNEGSETDSSLAFITSIEVAK